MFLDILASRHPPARQEHLGVEQFEVEALRVLVPRLRVLVAVGSNAR